MLSPRVSKASDLVFWAAVFAVFSHVSVASAQPVEGCDQRVLNAMQSAGQVNRVFDTAARVELTNQAENVNVLACLNKSAGVSAARGGNIFSGDFTSSLATVIPDSLGATYDDHIDSIGKKKGVIPYNETALQNSTDCDHISTLRDYHRKQGITQGVPYPTMAQKRGGSINGGEDFNESVKANRAVISEHDANMSALPRPSPVSYGGANTVCDVIARSGGSCGGSGP